jgi:HEPN domain-containing protein
VGRVEVVMTKEEKIQHWLNLSDYDLVTAEALLLAKRYLYVAFACQQAIEKAFKAYHVKTKNEEPVYTHDLLRLAEKSGLIDFLTIEQRRFADAVNTYYIETRYQEYKSHIAKTLTYDRCAELLKQTKNIHQWTKEKILSVR